MNGSPNPILEARLHPTGFDKADSNFYSMSLASDQSIYFTLSSHDIDTHARVYRYNPARDELRQVADFGEVTGEAGKKTLPQGKSHTPFFEHNRKLYVATHYGYFRSSNGKEERASVPPGYKPYPGGRFLELDMDGGACRALGSAPPEEGILAMTMDAARGRLYGLTWPGGLFLCHDLATGETRNLGPVSRDGEAGDGDRYFCLCRTLSLFQDTGDVYFTNPDGEILFYSYERDAVVSVDWAHMRKDIFGEWDPHRPGHQGYNWRACRWHPGHGVFYGVHPKSGFLFVFDPRNRRHEVIDRICSDVVRRDGRYEFFRYGYLTLDFAPHDPDTIYYISGYFTYREGCEPAAAEQARAHGSGIDRGRPETYGKIDSFLTFVTYHLPSGRYRDHGVLRLEDGRYPINTQSIAAHPNGRVYTCPWIRNEEPDRGGKPWAGCDLISFAVPGGAD